MEQNVLEVKNLTVSFHTEKGVILPVNDVTLTVPVGKIVGIVGESGCGKSMTARAIMGLLRFPGKVTGEKSFCAAGRSHSFPKRNAGGCGGLKSP